MEMRCFWPTESWTPRVPTTDSYPSGMAAMSSWISAIFAALTTSSYEAPGFA